MSDRRDISSMVQELDGLANEFISKSSELQHILEHLKLHKEGVDEASAKLYHRAIAIYEHVIKKSKDGIITSQGMLLEGSNDEQRRPRPGRSKRDDSGVYSIDSSQLRRSANLDDEDSSTTAIKKGVQHDEACRREVTSMTFQSEDVNVNVIAQCTDENTSGDCSEA